MNYVHDNGAQVQIYLREDDRYQGARLYETLLDLAREMRLSGATLVHASEGFGASSAMHSDRLLRVTEDLPLVIKVVDRRDRLDPFLGRVETILAEAEVGGFVTVEPVEMIHPA